MPVETRPVRRKPKSRLLRGVAVTSAIAAAFVGAPLVIHQFTPRLYDAVFKTLIGLVKSAVVLGPYADRVSAISETGPIRIPAVGAPDAALTIYTPADDGSAPRPVVLLIHGGGWVVGSAAQLSDYAKLIASEGNVVANLDYSLAPGHTYPTPIRQAAAAVDWLHAHAHRFRGDPTKMFLAGNSAGAQIASQVAAMITNPAMQQAVAVDVRIPRNDLRGVILYCGPYDFDTVAQTGFPAMRTYAWSYVGQKDYEHYRRIDELSTAKNVTPDYPPTYLTAGDGDPLEPQTRQLDTALRGFGVDVTSRYWTGTGLMLPHDYMFDLRTEAARTAFSDTVDFISSHSRSGGRSV